MTPGPTARLTEGALMAALSFVLNALGQVPPLTFVLPMLSPLPVTVAAVRRGPGTGLMVGLVASCLTFGTFGLPGLYLYVVPFGLIGVLAGWLLDRFEDGSVVLALGSLGSTLGLLAGVVGIERLLGFTEGMAELRAILTVALSWPAGMVATAVEAAGRLLRGVPGLAPAGSSVAGVAGAWVGDGPVGGVEALVECLLRVPLGVLFPMGALFFYAHHLASALLLWRVGHRVAPPPPPDAFRVGPGPAAAILAAALLTGGLLLGGARDPGTSFLANLVLVGGFFLYLQGLGVAIRGMDRRKLGPKARLAISIGCLVLFPLAMLVGIARALRQAAPAERPPESLVGFREE